MTRSILHSLVPLALVGLTIFMVDPLQHYRRRTFYLPQWWNERYYNPGFVKHYDYDCIIVGSSMMDNFALSDVDRKLSVKSLLAPMGGATPYEEYILLNCALATGKLRTVIWGMDLEYFGAGRKKLRYGPGSMPFYLYDENPFNDFHYFLNIDILLEDCVAVLASSPSGRRVSRALSRDSAYFRKRDYSRESVLRNWHVPKREQLALSAVRESQLDSMKGSFDSNVIPLLERSPNVEYRIFYPPYSIVYWISADSCKLGTFLEFKRYVFEECRRFPNVKLFDFQDVSDITLNLDNYSDYSHHSPAVSELIIDAISQDQHLVTDDNIEEKISRLEGQVRMFADSLSAARTRP